MKTSEIVERLDEVRGVAEESAAFDPVHTEALDEAIDRLTTPTDRCFANEILLWAGLIFGSVGLIATMCGVLYIILGACDRAWALLPWALVSGGAALLSFAGVRK
ncbi:MAG: hypothetical protein LUE61_07145 [Clostridiales bacterium]|nr:hypothetical protein [Clostridiales bacterium]